MGTRNETCLLWSNREKSAASRALGIGRSARTPGPASGTRPVDAAAVDARTCPQRLGQPALGPSTAPTGRAVIIGFDQRKIGRTGRTTNPAERPMAAGSVCGLLLATKSRHMPARERENDVSGRFTNDPGRDSPTAWLPPLVFSSAYTSKAASGADDRAFRGWTGAPPFLPFIVRHRAGMTIAHFSSPFRGGSPSTVIPAGRLKC